MCVSNEFKHGNARWRMEGTPNPVFVCVGGGVQGRGNSIDMLGQFTVSLTVAALSTLSLKPCVSACLAAAAAHCCGVGCGRHLGAC